MLELPLWWWLAPAGAGFALLFAGIFCRQVLAEAPGDDEIQRIAGYVREGAFAYLKQQYRFVAIVFAVLALLLVWQSFGLKQQHGLVPFAFLTGGFFSGLGGFVRMNTVTMAVNRHHTNTTPSHLVSAVFDAPVLTTDARNRRLLRRSGPTRWSDIDLIRHVGGTPSRGAVKSHTD